ncbi:MAG TPA: hypothetical protein PLL69_02595 [Gemmatimonadales bacterium]|nr:hypothetical protein [Gemmatimonadales bacterium]
MPIRTTARPAAGVVGLGNVAIDVTRILAKAPTDLATTDIARHATDRLTTSALREIHVFGRRGPVQAAFTTPELRELGELPGVDIVVDLELDAESAAHLAASGDRNLAKNLEVLREWAARPAGSAPRRIHLHFCVSPVEVIGPDRVTALRLVRNRLEPDGRGGVRAVPTGEEFTLPIGLLFRSVGYRGVPIDGLPFDETRGVVPNVEGRVVEHVDSHTCLNGVYVAGWIKRGPSGVIGTNKLDATQTVDHLLADAAAGRINLAGRSPDELLDRLGAQGARITTWDGWLAIDRHETELGKPAGKPREKLTKVEEMLTIAHGEHGK